MFSFLKHWIAGGDDARRRESPAAEQARKLEMDEPMAGAGAQLSADRPRGETEKNLERGD